MLETKEQKVKKINPNAICESQKDKDGRTLFVIKDKITEEVLGTGYNSTIAWFNAYTNMLQTA